MPLLYACTVVLLATKPQAWSAFKETLFCGLLLEEQAEARCWEYSVPVPAAWQKKTKGAKYTYTKNDPPPVINPRVRCRRFRSNISLSTRVEQDFDLFSSDSSYASAWEVTEDSAIGTLFLEISQGSYSHTEVEDIEPLEIGALFGNVGGFWGTYVRRVDV